ncbi:BTAD domain-containing putative transcriptional regulator [Nonomuraea sp. NPDC003709]|uniref:BTAD domain-containing putative transcriptional regulator n=1 Tax=Nonomuraea sp. NPDC003709 TaxID=3154450 RepID=UPI00339DAD1E
MARRDPSGALDAYTRALALWQGMAAEDVPLGSTLREVVARLTDHYLCVVEEHAEIQRSAAPGCSERCTPPCPAGSPSAILHKLRCRPLLAGQLVKAILVLQLREAG